jgi:hypothetical protein
MKKTTVRYYLSSFQSILMNVENWYLIPLLLFLHPLRFTLKNKGTFFADNFMDVWTLKEVLIDDCYKVNTLKKQSTIIDIGAAIGDFSILLSYKADHVISCEFDNNRLLMLRGNIQLAKRKNILIIPEKITTLDSIIASLKTPCDLLKIDCEGSEYPIFLQSKLSTLKKIKRIVGELHFFNDDMRHDFIRLKQQFKKAGFVLKTWENPVHNSICYFTATR